MPKEISGEEKALVCFDYIYHAMRGKHVLQQAGFDMREVSPPVEYRTGCDLALELSSRDVEAAERILDEKSVLVMDVLFLPKDTKLAPAYLSKLIKTKDIGDYTMVRCGNMKITYRKGVGTIVNISGGA
ncbi:MAG: hypothetical protein CL877_03065 [Dehalococcoidales bacterium]|nr:hypothetical protein [Dehalococcoidales bacterium]MDP6221869.1 DUF3343 domain-containing protein [Dehalococcoidales bacterium]MDP7110137.1 DUF3343 domain-containing protein [Dehalococcoidales bacterium]MDP7310192.1 DUF3343 domain-containing protein [Dehalococcoidales bacterium]MDP7409184.1 DUF3343 domain-containing protein [Dehalococcoidales bacterium]